MSEVLIKPYELSIWDNELTNTEQKIAVIGTHLFKTPNMAYDIVFRKNKNGEKTLSFSIKYKYYNPETEQMEENPFAPYLINERKVKLYYDNNWYDFIIKEVEEGTEEYTWSYVAYDAFVLELSKNGYDIEFSNELNNNLGTALELATKTLENTDWEAIDIDTPAPKVAEPIFEGRLLTDVAVKNMDDDSDTSFESGTEILIFYSYLSNENGINLQFILKEDDTSKYNIDSTNVISATNYRFDYELEFETTEDSEGHTVYYINDKQGNHVIWYSYAYQIYEGYRLVYQQISSYDAIMERIVDQYTDGPNYINHYTDSVYTTSNVVTSFVANGDKFSTYEDGSTYGWDRYGGENGWPEIELTTYPKIDPENPIVDLNSINQIEGYLQVHFNAGEGSYLYNDGIESNQSLIGSITKGDKFVFRWRGGKAATDHGTLTKMSENDIRAKVCFYKEKEIESEEGTRYVKVPISDIIPFNGVAEVLNNRITGGTLVNNTQYILDGVEQVPSSKFLYVDSGHVDEHSGVKEYYWDSTIGENGEYVEYDEETNQRFLDYYYLIGTALTAVTEDQLKDPIVHLGIFIYCNGDINNYYYLQDVQLTRLYRDEAGNVLTIGNVPRAIARLTDYYYIAPKEGDDKNKIPLFLSLEDLAEEYGLDVNKIKPVYNQGNILFTDVDSDIFWVKKEQLRQLYEKFEVQGYTLSKVSTIEASNSNYFDILQTIAEAFECWIEIYVEHNEDGSIYLDEEGKPLKTILLREFSGDDNFAGFKYGINIDQINRTVDSNEVVTKLIVDDSNSDLVDDGVISIAQAESNPNKESYIYRFDYFLNQGLLPREEFTQDLNEYNAALRQLNTTLYDLQEQSIQLSNSLVSISSNRNVYGSLLTAAHEKMNDALDEFEDLTGYTYEEYQQRSGTESQSSSINDDDDDDDSIEAIGNVDKTREIVGTIYNCAAVENSYRGLYTNTEAEYNNLNQELNGIKDHVVTAVCIQSETSWYLRVKLDDYIVPFKFTVNGIEYETSLSNKNFEIEINNNEVDITDIVYSTNDITGYQFVDSGDNPITTIHATSSVVQTFRLVPNSPAEGINTRIDELIKQKKEIIKQFNIKYGRFILEGNWSSQEYLSDELYYLDAAIAGRVSAFPKVTYNVNVVDVSGLNDYQAYNFDAGEKTYIEDTEFFGWIDIDGVKTPAKEEVIISEIEWHLDDPSQNSITIQNYKDHFEDLFQRIQATVQTVQYNEITYPNTRTIIDEEKRINQALLIASLSRVAGAQRPLTTDGSIAIDGDSIDILNLTNRLNRVRLSSEGITISSDGGATWSAAITGEGINIGNVISDFINTKEIWIGSKDSPSFRWDNNGISAFRLGDVSGGEPKYNFKQFVRFDQYGLYGIDLKGKETSEYVVSGLQDIKNDASFAVTWDGFFIKNKYTGGGRVEITSMDDFRVINGNDNEVIKIGALEWGNSLVPVDGVAPTKYGIRIRNNSGEDMFVTGNDGNLAIVNTLRVGAIDENDSHPHIVIDGQEAYIKSSNYSDGAGTGWMINKDGDAYFNNITARGAIKTAVFEYAEIQAVGGVFIFRPSSTIRSAAVDGDDLVLTVEKPLLFKTGDWCKVSNYTENGEADNPDIDIDDDSGDTSAEDIAKNNGLLHIYQISDITTDSDITYITLGGAAAMVGQAGAVNSEEQLVGGALVDMGDSNGESNYGIGINSSDNTVNLPAKAISLFETVIGNSNPKVTYKYTAILGTLPTLPNDQVSNSIYNNLMADTQGIYTDNMYIGDSNQYIAFYTDSESPTPEKHFVIRVKEFELEANSLNQGSPTTGYVYLSNTSKYLSGDSTGWRLLLGSNFKVSEAGNLFANNATINGHLNATTLSTGNRNSSIAGTGLTGTFIDSNGAIYVGENNEFTVTEYGALTATNATIVGNITATSGKIGNWNIENPTNNTFGGALYTNNYVFGSGVLVSPGYTPNNSEKVGRLPVGKTWAFTAGDDFGVTIDGELYASGAQLEDIDMTTITGGTEGQSGYVYISKNAKSATINNILKNWNLILGTNFAVDETGYLSASSGKIANWSISSNALSTGNYNTSGTMYFGESGLSLGNTFKVTSEGALTATDGTIGGWKISANTLQSSNGTVGLKGSGTSASDVVFWAGSATPTSAPFRVTRDGGVVATNLSISGYATTSYVDSAESRASAVATDFLEKSSGNYVKLKSAWTSDYLIMQSDGIKLYCNNVALASFLTSGATIQNQSGTNYITISSSDITIASSKGKLTLDSTGVDVGTSGSGTSAFTFGGNPILKVVIVSKTFSINGTSTKNVNISYSNSNFKVLGIVGWSIAGTGCSGISTYKCYWSSSYGARFYFKNRTSTDRSGLQINARLLITPKIDNWDPDGRDDGGDDE